jgi:hypothetical protein
MGRGLRIEFCAWCAKELREEMTAARRVDATASDEGGRSRRDKEGATAQKSGKTAGRMPEGRRFVRGMSGNPGGRPRVPEHVRVAARSLTFESIQTLADVMRDRSQTGSSRVAAANSLLDRAWGRPETTSHVNVTRDVRDLSTSELLAAIASERAAGEEASDGDVAQLC